MGLRRLRIIVPAHNEAARIEPTLRDYCRAFSALALVVVVANGCSDDTARIVRELQTEFDNLRLIEIPARIGKGGAVRVGVVAASEAYVGFIDADGSTPACEFARLYAERGDADAVIGSRWLPHSRLEPAQPPARRIASRVFNLIVRLCFGLPFSDTQCGAKLFKRTALSAILGSLEAADFAFDIEILWRLVRRGFAVREVPTLWRNHPASTVSLVPAAARMLATVVRMRLRESPFWTFPYCDILWRKGTIPVKSSPHVLVLGDAAPFQSIVAALDRGGARVTFAADALAPQLRRVFPAPRSAPFKLAFLMWYVFASERRFDAILEFAGKAPAVIPWFSVKPSFYLDRRRKGRDLYAALCRALYRRARFITCPPAADEVAAAVIEQADAHGSHASFHQVGERVSIAYEDAASRRRVRQELTE